MSSKKKSSGKQPTLFSFYSSAKKLEMTSPSKVDIKVEEDEQVSSPVFQDENMEPLEILSDFGDNDESCNTTKSTMKRQRVIESSDEDEPKAMEINFSSKRNKIVPADGSPIRKTPLTVKNEASTPLTVKNKASTPTSSFSAKINGGKMSERGQSFIGSMKFDESFSSMDANVSLNRSALSDFKNHETKDALNSEEGNAVLEQRFPHLHHPDFAFLNPTEIQDAMRRRPDNPDYDCRTLFVPNNFLNNQTAGHKQWWTIKSKHFDEIIFFKVGKFYELYHMDAVIGMELANLKSMGGKYAHCGFPEKACGLYTDQFVNSNYKIVRVEQTESKQNNEERCKNTKNKDDKIMKREICRIVTPGTRTYSFMEGTDNRETDGLNESEAKYLMALTEKRTIDALSIYGVCFVDCSTGQFILSQFTDDRNQSALRTLLAQHYPAQLLIEKGSLSPITFSLLNSVLYNVPRESLIRGKEFLGAQETMNLLMEEKYLGSEFISWPDVLKKGMSDIKAALPKPSEDFALMFSSLGAIVGYLRKCLIDEDIITMKLFSEYRPLVLEDIDKTVGVTTDESHWKDRRMILDGITLQSLHVLPSSTSNGNRNLFNTNNCFLFTVVDRCSTLFGKRLLRQWICSPICDPKNLQERQQAVKVLRDSKIFVNRAVDKLQTIPDLERLFQRIHSTGLKRRKDHPENMANYFELPIHNKRKIKDLVLALDALKHVQEFVDLYNSEEFDDRSILLDKCLATRFPEIETDLHFFTNAFDIKDAYENGRIVPIKGVDSEYDRAIESCKKCEAELGKYLEEQRKKFNSQKIVYCGTGKNRYQLEIPEAAAGNIGSDYTSEKGRKGYKRFKTIAIVNMFSKLENAEHERDLVRDDITRRVFADFDHRKDKWARIVKNLSICDCLLALCRYSINSGLIMCFPEFVFNSNEPFIDIRAGYHPSLVSSSLYGSKVSTNDCKGSALKGAFEYIPNDCVLGKSENGDGKETLVMLLTGPNMGGKSTLMRQVSALVILAQIGSMVPAQSMKLTPVDRIYTRIGASDNLAAGQSTFFVELAETNLILRGATKHSLVLIDELGRGTSTHDGTAIAFSVLKFLANRIKCRTIFSTHYHALCEMIRNNPGVRLAHMACVSENENMEDPTEENITFLYTLIDGPSLKSYGFYTAKIAGINVEVIRKAIAATQLLNN